MQTGLIIEMVSPYWVLNNQNIRWRAFMALKIVLPSRHQEQDQSEWKYFIHQNLHQTFHPLLLWSSLIAWGSIQYIFMAVYNMTPYMLVSIRELLGFDSLLTPPILVPGRDLVWFSFWNTVFTDYSCFKSLHWYIRFWVNWLFMVERDIQFIITQ